MSWLLIDKKSEKTAEVFDNRILTIGNTKDCDIVISEKEKVQIYSQIFLENGFIFQENFNSKNVFYLNKIFLFHNHKFEFKYNKKNNFILPNENEISFIYHSELFKNTLNFVQNEFSKNQKLLLLPKQEQEIYFLQEACHYLNKFYWDDKDIYKSEHRLHFQKIIWCLCSQAFAQGVLTLLLLDDSVTEIMVNDAQRIYLERNGTISLSDLMFDNNNALMAIIERMCNQVGRRIDESIPFCDARLPDGSRVHAIIPPLALNGPCLTIRKFPKQCFSIEDLIAKKSISEDILPILKDIIISRKNILISGGTGTGKTTLLNCLTTWIHPNERIITIEDSAELKLQQPHVIRLESRKENIEAKGGVSIRELVKNALRMRPDRIIVGECRGGEALDMLQAMNTGHDGSMTTIHSNSAEDALRRLETLVLFASSELPSRAIREQIASAIHYVIQLTRKSDGHRCVTSIHQIVTLCERTHKFITNSLFEWNK
ncbi:CpaF family protein [Silvanigrella aquatica]|uniref:AAA+ ATPase domain-containing protein n=1 Tax=Silvanigrella aquatica TaxID=1915309 RepID=A0A1L4D1K8_9BACT|nr:CpaF family protein [Silvanigrella aquatica]APJ04078.1 hypothetical protein AXG55_09230 [Silvanigrella aquatica]